MPKYRTDIWQYAGEAASGRWFWEVWRKLPANDEFEEIMEARGETTTEALAKAAAKIAIKELKEKAK